MLPGFSVSNWLVNKNDRSPGFSVRCLMHVLLSSVSIGVFQAIKTCLNFLGTSTGYSELSAAQPRQLRV